jgi:hypothetical protein
MVGIKIILTKNFFMKKSSLVILVLFFIVSIELAGQDNCIYNVTHSELYLNFRNILYTNIKDDSIQIFTDNGKIINRKNAELKGEQFFIVPDSLGKANINIYKYSDKDSCKLLSKQFIVVEIPSPVPHVAGFSGGLIDKDLLFSQVGIGAEYNILKNLNWHRGINKVIKYSILITRDNELIFSHNNLGFKFSEKFKDFRNQIKKGDIVLFYNIHIENEMKQEQSIQPLEFLIK